MKPNRKKLHELLDAVLDVHETKGLDGWYEISGHVEWISVATSITGDHYTKLSNIDCTNIHETDEVFDKVIAQYQEESSNKNLRIRKKRELEEKEKAELERLKRKYDTLSRTKKI